MSDSSTSTTASSPTTTKEESKPKFSAESEKWSVENTVEAAKRNQSTWKPFSNEIESVFKVARSHPFKFWSEQPQPKFTDEVPTIEQCDVIEADKTEIKPEPYTLPAGVEWCVCDMKDPAVLDEVHSLLEKNYVEDDDCMFRFAYSKEFLQWALVVPDVVKDWHIGVRNSSGKKKLLAFISAIPQRMRVYEKTMNMVEINFLCVHKKLREKRVAPVLIMEITRRVNLRGTFQACYTAGAILPTPLATSAYHHRPLNYKKLVEVHFVRLTQKMTMARGLRIYKLPNEFKLPGVREMEPRDMGAVAALLKRFMTKFCLAPEFTTEDIEHWLTPVKGVVYTYVVEDPDTKCITDFFSFYSLPSTVIGNEKHNVLNAAYMYYTVPMNTPMKDLMSAALVAAKQCGFDVMNSLDLLEFGPVLKDTNFTQGDGNLHFYLYNYRATQMPPGEVGLVLV